MATMKDTGSLTLDAIQTQIGFIEGKVLTVIDATYSNSIQNKAVKDLIRSAFREQRQWIGKLATGSDNGGELLQYDHTEV